MDRARHLYRARQSHPLRSQTGLDYRLILLTKAVTTALVEVHDRKLDTETLAMQKRMTERAYQAYLNGGGGFMGDRTLEKAFIVPDREKDRRLKKVSFTLY